MFLVLQHQDTRWHPVDVLDEVDERKRLGDCEIAVYEMKGNPPKLKLVWQGKQKTSIRSTEVK